MPPQKEKHQQALVSSPCCWTYQHACFQGAELRGRDVLCLVQPWYRLLFAWWVLRGHKQALRGARKEARGMNAMERHGEKCG